MSNVVDFQIFKDTGLEVSPEEYGVAVGQIIDEANRSAHFAGVLLKDIPALVLGRAKQLKQERENNG